MYCTSCGTQLSDSSPICVQCPHPITQNTKPLRDIEHELRFILPMGTAPFALMAGYLGLFSVLFIPAPFALIFGIIGLKTIKRNPDLRGKTRCWVGIIMGAVFTSLFLLFILGSLI